MLHYAVSQHTNLNSITTTTPTHKPGCNTNKGVISAREGGRPSNQPADLRGKQCGMCVLLVFNQETTTMGTTSGGVYRVDDGVYV